MANPIPIAKPSKIALLGAETLLGRELKDVIGDRLKSASLSLYAANAAGSFGEQEGEAAYVEPFEAEAARASKAVLVAGTDPGARKAYALVKAARGVPKIIDCTGHLEQQPEARILAPLLEQDDPKTSWLLVIAHPAACALALTLKRLARYQPIVRSVANIFEPASERGKEGIAELQQQTTGLLAFKSLNKRVFDEQLSFNMLARYGESAPVKLSSIEQRIENGIATIFSREAKAAWPPLPSIRLTQAPVFHGYSMSLWVEFEKNALAGELAEALASAQIEVRGSNDEPPTNVGVAGQSGLSAGDIRVDRNNPRAAWLWIVCDNLRLTASSAVDLLTRIL